MKRSPALRLLLVLLAASLLGAGCRVKLKENQVTEKAAFTPEEQAAVELSIREFLGALDREDASSWNQFSLIMKSNVSESAWSVALSGFKTACGANLGRENPRFACTENLEDAPPGRYFIYDFDSKFERIALTERVVLVAENKEWKIAGYFRKKTFSLGGDAKKS